MNKKDKITVKKVKILNKKGIHARPAATLVKAANAFDSEIYLTKDEITINGKSIIGLMTLAAAQGQFLEIKAIGKDSEEAVEILSEIIESKFGED